MSWLNPKETEIIVKNIVNSVILDLELIDLDEYCNEQYKKELFVFFKKILLKYGLLKTEFITTVDL